jgi:hypothetical protein
MSMERYEITAPDDAEGYPPFVVNGVGVNTVIADGNEELNFWLREAYDGDIPATWRQLPDEQS